MYNCVEWSDKNWQFRVMKKLYQEKLFNMDKVVCSNNKFYSNNNFTVMIIIE